MPEASLLWDVLGDKSKEQTKAACSFCSSQGGSDHQHLRLSETLRQAGKGREASQYPKAMTELDCPWGLSAWACKGILGLGEIH